MAVGGKTGLGRGSPCRESSFADSIVWTNRR